MRNKGYEVKGGETGDGALKYISFRPGGKERFVRGSAKSLGADYTRERILERIEERLRRPAITSRTVRIRTAADMTRTRESMIDTSAERFQKSAGLARWARTQNLKAAAHIYSQAGSVSEIRQEAGERQSAAKEARSRIVKLERGMKELKEAIYYAE